MRISRIWPLLVVALVSAPVLAQDPPAEESESEAPADEPVESEAESGGPESDDAPATDEGTEDDASPPEADPEEAAEPELDVADIGESDGKAADARPESFFVERALGNADVIDAHRARIQKAQWQQYRADWGWFPKVRAETGFSIVPAGVDPDNIDNNFDEISSFDVGPVFSQSVGLIIPLYTFDRLSIAEDLAEIGIDVEELKLEGARRDVEFQVRRAYYAIQLSNALGDLLAEGGELIKEQLQEMEDARDFGEADFEIEELRKLQIFDAEIDARRLDNEKLGTVAEAGLRYFTAYEAEISVESLDSDEEPSSLADLPTYKAAARAMRPEAQLLNNAVKARKLQKELAKSEFYPNIFFAGTFRVVESTEDIALRKVCRQTEPGGECVDTSDLIAPPYTNPLDVFSFGVALGMRWDFDYPQLYGKYREVAAQNDEVLAQKRRALGAIDLEITKLWTDASHARQKVFIQERRLDAARRWRDQFGLSMQQGGADIEDAVEPLKAFFEARALYLQARFEYQVARAELAKAVGVKDLSEVSGGSESK